LGDAQCSGGNVCKNKSCVEDDGGAGGAGGAGGDGNLGGQGGVDGNAGGDSSGTTPDTDGCHPKVTLLLQRSGSMFEYPSGDTKWWSAVASALTSGSEALLTKYSSDIDLGVTTFHMTEPGSSCLLEDSTTHTVKRSVLEDFLAEQANEHEQLVDDETKVDAPLAAALDRAAQELGSEGERYLLLAVSGNPDSCSNLDGQCETVGALAKVRELRMAGIRTKLLFLESTELDGYAQALANVAAGRGARNFVENMCDTDFNFATTPMDAEYGDPENVDQVRGELEQLLTQIAACE